MLTFPATASVPFYRWMLYAYRCRPGPAVLVHSDQQSGCAAADDCVDHAACVDNSCTNSTESDAVSPYGMPAYPPPQVGLGLLTSILASMVTCFCFLVTCMAPFCAWHTALRRLHAINRQQQLCTCSQEPCFHCTMEQPSIVRWSTLHA